MPCPNSARKRSKTITFRLTPEEYALLCDRIALSGMNRQEYIYKKTDGHGGSRQAVREGPQGPERVDGENLSTIARIRAGGTLSDQMEAVIEMLTEEFGELGPATEKSEIDKETISIWNLERG